MTLLIKREKAKLHKGQAEIWKSLNQRQPPKTTVIAAGARWGKDRFCLQAMIALAQRLYLMERETRRRKRLVPLVLGWYVAPTFSLLRQSWDELKAIAAGSDYIKLNNSELRAYLYNDIQLEFKSADKPGSLLARGVDIAILTEAARIKEDSFSRAVMTRLSSPGRGPAGTGGLAILNSTPDGQNWFYDLYQQAKREQEQATAEGRPPIMQAYHFTSYDNPLANVAELNRHRQILPDAVFRQEYLAEFISRGGNVFPKLPNALKCYDFPQRENIGKGVYHIGIDWGRHKDNTAVCVVQKQGDRIRLVGFLLLKNMEYSRQIQEIARLCEDFPTAEIIAEDNAMGGPQVEGLDNAVTNSIYPFHTGHTNKENLIETVVSHFERGEIELPSLSCGAIHPDIKELFEELSCFEITQQRGGMYVYSAPSGKHDDTVIAFCLAVAGKKHRSGMVLRGVRCDNY